MNHVMIDIETLGNRKTSAIATIGAVVFGEGFVSDNTFYTRVDWVDALKYGTLDASTMKWWMKQNEEARLEMVKDGGISLKKALRNFSDWLPKEPIVWGNGSVFDMPILEHGFREVNVKIPWHYRNIRDVRTIVELTDGYINPRDFSDGNVVHNALDDAVYQAKYVSEMLKLIKESLKRGV